MVNVGIYIYTDNVTDLSSVFVDSFASRVQSNGGTLEAANCLLTELQNLGGYSGVALQAKRVELFSDEKISVTSSVQNINNIGATYSDFSQTFTVPATKNNNKIFKHWYENSLDIQFNTLTKADAYIELDTIPFRVGKIQLEGCNIKNGQPQSYSITFIGNLGNLKDKFAGLFLKDLPSTNYDISYTADIVKNKVVSTAVSADVMFPLISSNRYWNYGGTGLNDITIISNPIRYNELFPAVKLKTVFNMIEDRFDVNLQGTTENPSVFLTDKKFTSAYLYLKNAEIFTLKSEPNLITWDTKTEANYFDINLTNDTWRSTIPNEVLTADDFVGQFAYINLSFTVVGLLYSLITYKNGVEILRQSSTTVANTGYIYLANDFNTTDIYSVSIVANEPVTFNAVLTLQTLFEDPESGPYVVDEDAFKTTNQTTVTPKLSLKEYMPEIKIEDFFSGILKMFNLTCYSSNGIDYTIDTLENYYNLGTIVDLTKHIKSDVTDFTRVKTYKKINFLYEKSESLVNVGFLSNAGVDYGNLLYNTESDGGEYSIKLPFEDLNFNNLKDKLQVGYALKTDLQKYIPKPIILYDYNPDTLTSLVATNFYFSNSLSGNGTSHASYKAFGQEFKDGGSTYSLNFPDQQSTLTNEVITNSLYKTYYSNYISNIFNYRARLVKVNAILPISVLTSLNLNNRVIIRDKRYIINSFTTDLTTGEASLELLTDLRTNPIQDPYANYITAQNFDILETEELIKFTVL
jgi:hypothetical protein